MGKADSPLNMRLRMSLQQWRWLLQFLRACNNQTNKMNGDHILRLSLLSRQVMQAWRDEDNLADFHWRRSAKVPLIHRLEYDFNKAAKGIDPQYQQALNAEACLQLEPALKHISPSLQGGIYSPGDETADCHQSLPCPARQAQCQQRLFSQADPVRCGDPISGVGTHQQPGDQSGPSPAMSMSSPPVTAVGLCLGIWEFACRFAP